MLPSPARISLTAGTVMGRGHGAAGVTLKGSENSETRLMFVRKTRPWEFLVNMVSGAEQMRAGAGPFCLVAALGARGPLLV